MTFEDYAHVTSCKYSGAIRLCFGALLNDFTICEPSTPCSQQLIINMKLDCAHRWPPDLVNSRKPDQSYAEVGPNFFSVARNVTGTNSPRQDDLTPHTDTSLGQGWFPITSTPNRNRSVTDDARSVR